MNLRKRSGRYCFGILLLVGFLGSAGAAELKAKYVSPESLPGAVRVSAEKVIYLVDTIPELVIIDSRTANDRQMGHIEGSIGLTDIHTDCGILANYLQTKASPVLFYCNGINCKRSDNAVKIARECEYTQIYWFRGGIEEWREKKLPLVQ